MNLQVILVHTEYKHNKYKKITTKINFIKYSIIIEMYRVLH